MIMCLRVLCCLNCVLLLGEDGASKATAGRLWSHFAVAERMGQIHVDILLLLLFKLIELT